MRQTWKDLLFLHWEVPVETLRALVPAPLEIDTFEGRAYVGVVPFTMHDVLVGPLRAADFWIYRVRVKHPQWPLPEGVAVETIAREPRRD